MPWDEIAKIVEDVHRETHAPVRTTAIVTRYHGMSPRQIQRYLETLESAQRIKRVGVRSGWVPNKR